MALQSIQPRPLEGVRVVEFSHVIAGPYTGLQLLRLGAEVTKVEPPHTGDFLALMPHGQRAYEALNEGKQVLRIDITTAEGLARALALVDEADVVIDSFAPGSLARKGLGYEALAARRPRLVYCSISGFGTQDPAWGARGAYDHVVQAMTGIARQNGKEGDPPIKVGFPLTDTATGMTALSAIMAALMTRYRSDRGQYLEVSMARAAMQLLFPMACDTAVTGIDAPRIGNTGYSGSPGAGFFEASDGWVALGANTAEQVARALAALHVKSSAERPAAQALAQGLRALSAEQAEQRLVEAGVPVARLRSVAEFIDEATRLGWLQGGGEQPARWAAEFALGWRSFHTVPARTGD